MQTKSENHETCSGVVLSHVEAVVKNCDGFKQVVTSDAKNQTSPLAKKSDGKANFAECFLPGTRQSLCRVPDTRQSWNRKKPEKNGTFFNRWRPPPDSARPAPAIFRVKFAATRPAGFEPATSSSSVPSFNHCTTLPLMSRFRFGSSHIILNRV